MRAGVGVGYLWPDVEWERRHVAQVWCSDHRIIAENLATTTKERRATMGGRCPVVSAVGRTGVEEHVVEVQWNTRKRCFSTNLGSPHGPKETELVVLVRPAPDSRRSPTAIGDGVPREEESYSTTKNLERRATREAQRPRCGVAICGRQ